MMEAIRKGEPPQHKHGVGVRRFLVVGICLLFWSCATGSQVKVVAEVANLQQAKSRSVAVVPDLFMDDPEKADRLAQLMRDQLASKGFQVKDSEDEADLVVVPTIEQSRPVNSAVTARGPKMRRPFDVSYALGQSSLMESQNALRNLGFDFGTLPEQEQPKVGLTVIAVSREVWLQGLLEPRTEIPSVWRIVAISPLQEQDVTLQLVEAVGAKLNEITAAPVSEKPTPTPSASPKKKP
jgi:hypothetical protein